MFMQIPKGRPTQRHVLGLFALILTATAGCGYSVRPPYDMSVKTVYVPIFRSQTFRREIQLQLTELVIKEIEKRTPYKVVGRLEDADTILEGTVNYADKNTVVENPFNLPRQLTTTIQASVNWVHNPPLEYEQSRQPTVVAETVNFEPEIGESAMAAYYRTSQNLATQIVDMMEVAWSSNHE